MARGSRIRDTELQLRVTQLIRSGNLPQWTPARIGADHGDGNVCVACDRQIAKDDIEYEIHDGRSGRQLNFHLDCCAVWQAECIRQLVPAKRAPVSAHLQSHAAPDALAGRAYVATLRAV